MCERRLKRRQATTRSAQGGERVNGRERNIHGRNGRAYMYVLHVEAHLRRTLGGPPHWCRIASRGPPAPTASSWGGGGQRILQSLHVWGWRIPHVPRHAACKPGVRPPLLLRRAPPLPRSWISADWRSGGGQGPGDVGQWDGVETCRRGCGFSAGCFWLRDGLVRLMTDGRGVRSKSREVQELGRS